MIEMKPFQPADFSVFYFTMPLIMKALCYFATPKYKI